MTQSPQNSTLRSPGLVLRPLVESDVQGLLDLCRDALDLDVFHEDVLVRHVFGDPHHKSELAWVAESDGRLIGCAIGVVHTFRDVFSGRIKLWAVRRPAQGEGLGGRLLGLLEERFAAAGAKRAITQGAPHFFLPGVDVRYTRALCVLERRGYDLGEWSQNMSVDLEGLDLAPLPAETALRESGFVFERARPDDRAVLMAFAAQNFNAIWPRELEVSLTLRPITTFVARIDERIVAFASYDAVCLRGWFGPMGTAPDQRGKRLGDILLRRCLADMKTRGDKRCEICWVGPVGFYNRTVGARVSRVFRAPSKLLG